MTLRWFLALFLLIFAVQTVEILRTTRNDPPDIGDSVEMHNIAFNLAHGRGYSFDWDNPEWRKPWEDRNADGRFNFFLARRGAHPTMFRPPLIPVLVAGLLRVFPNQSFLAWRIVDGAVFAMAACLLCH